MALCKLALSDGSNLVAEEMEFGQGWNSQSHIVLSCPLAALAKGTSFNFLKEYCFGLATLVLVMF